MFAYQHPTNGDNYRDWRNDWCFIESIFERDAYAI